MTFYSDGDSGTPSHFVQAANPWYDNRDIYIVRFVADGCRKNLPLSDLRSMKDIVSFTVDDVELTTNTGFIGFADSVNERYFWLQPGETSTGLSPIKSEIWLERDDQRFGGSDGDWKISLSRDTFTVFTRGSAWLACDKIEIHFTIDDNSFNTLLTLLKTVMIDCADDLHVEH